MGLLAVTGLVVMATFALTAFMVVRAVRRRFRALRERLLRMCEVTIGSSRPDPPRLRAVSAATVGSPVWWAVQRDRHRMWRAVTAAEHAVGVAQQAGAPVGDLPALARQLSSAAYAVDAVLRASARSRGLNRSVATERKWIEKTAADVHRAAVESLKAVVDADTHPLVSAVQVEVQALAAGVRSAGYPARS